MTEGAQHYDESILPAEEFAKEGDGDEEGDVLEGGLVGAEVADLVEDPFQGELEVEVAHGFFVALEGVEAHRGDEQKEIPKKKYLSILQ